MPPIDQQRSSAPKPMVRSERLLPPVIVLLVFAMVVIGIAGFAYVSAQQQTLSQIRQDSDQLREALRTLIETDADVGACARPATARRLVSYFGSLEAFRARRATMLARLPDVAATLDRLEHDWNEAIGLSNNGQPDAARTLLGDRQTSATMSQLSDATSSVLAVADAQVQQYEDSIRIGTLAVLAMQVLSGTLGHERACSLRSGSVPARRLGARRRSNRRIPRASRWRGCSKWPTCCRAPATTAMPIRC